MSIPTAILDPLQTFPTGLDTRRKLPIPVIHSHEWLLPIGVAG